jgi:Zn-dependent protease
LPNIDPVLLLMQFVVMIGSLSIHEAAHAWSANRLGDNTARLLGRLTINPAAHVDVFGTIVLPLIAIVSNFPIIGYAKPVPVDPRNLGADWRTKFMLIAAAGPASNLVIALVGALVFQALGGHEAMTSRYSLVAFANRVDAERAPGDFQHAPGANARWRQRPRRSAEGPGRAAVRQPAPLRLPDSVRFAPDRRL